MQQLFAKLVPTIEGHIKKGGDALLGNPIFNLTLTEKQWHTLEQVQNDLHKEYTIRREMLLKRLDCTIQSFQVIKFYFDISKKTTNHTMIT